MKSDPQDEHDDIPQQSTLPLSEAIDKLHNAISSGNFKVNLAQEGVSSKFDKGFVIIIYQVYPKGNFLTQLPQKQLLLQKWSKISHKNFKFM